MGERLLIRKEIEMIRKKAEWNEHIHCHFVAGRLYREIERLENRLKELEEENK